MKNRFSIPQLVSSSHFSWFGMLEEIKICHSPVGSLLARNTARFFGRHLARSRKYWLCINPRPPIGFLIRVGPTVDRICGRCRALNWDSGDWEWGFRKSPRGLALRCSLTCDVWCWSGAGAGLGRWGCALIWELPDACGLAFAGRKYWKSWFGSNSGYEELINSLSIMEETLNRHWNYVWIFFSFY